MEGRADKIQVVDVGPLTYQEHTVKDQVSFNNNFTVTFRVRLLKAFQSAARLNHVISFQDRKSYKFLPEKSSVGEDEVLRVPNVPLISAAVHVKRMPLFKRLTAGFAIKQFREPLFKDLTASDFLWGYEDKIIKLESLGMGKRRFGLLMNVSAYL